MAQERSTTRVEIQWLRLKLGSLHVNAKGKQPLIYSCTVMQREQHKLVCTSKVSHCLFLPLTSHKQKLVKLAKTSRPSTKIGSLIQGYKRDSPRVPNSRVLYSRLKKQGPGNKMNIQFSNHCLMIRSKYCDHCTSRHPKLLPIQSNQNTVITPVT